MNLLQIHDGRHFILLLSDRKGRQKSPKEFVLQFF